MRSRDFCYWLQGFFEINDPGTRVNLSPEGVAKIRAHLALVFKHEIDPSIDGGDPKKKAELDAIHGPPWHPHPGESAGPEVVYRC